MVKNQPEMQERQFNPWVGKIPRRRAWQPTPVFLPRKSQGQRSLVGYSPQACRVQHDWSDWAWIRKPSGSKLKLKNKVGELMGDFRKWYLTWALDKEKDLDRLKCVLERGFQTQGADRCQAYRRSGAQGQWRVSDSGRPEANTGVRPCGKMTREVF